MKFWVLFLALSTGSSALDAQTVPSAAPSSGFQESMLKGKEFLLNQLDSRKGIFPEDYWLGPLQGWQMISQEEEGAYNVIYTYFSGFLTRDTMASLISESWRKLIVSTVLEAFEKGLVPLSFRIGSLRWEDPRTIYASIALKGEPGTARGLVYLEKAEGTWKITDLQLNFAEMKEEPLVRTETYQVGTYPFLLGF